MVALLTVRSNARTEGYNRTIKTITRVGCGYRNASNYPPAHHEPRAGEPWPDPAHQIVEGVLPAIPSPHSRR
jgi:Transposase